MRKQQWIILLTVLVLIGGTAGVLGWLKTHQKLGAPGVVTSAIPGSKRLKVELPEQVLDYTSDWRDAEEITLNVLPQDTSFGGRAYKAPDGFQLLLQAVLMGSDRTSIHKPQFCLRGMGLGILKTEAAVVPIEQPFAYELPVTKMIVAPEKPEQGSFRGIYVYWFVADNAYTADHNKRMWWMARDLVTTGVLQRWAYLSCYAPCAPGQEDAAFERVKAFIAAAVPQFHTTPKPKQTASRTP